MGTTIFLIIIGAALIFLNVRAIKKEKHSFQGSLHNAEIDMNEVDVRIGELRREFTEDIAELQIEIEELKEALGKQKAFKDNEASNEENKVKNKEEKNSKKKNEVENNIETGNKVNEVNKDGKKDVVKDKADKFEKSKGNENKNVKINEVSKLLESGLTTDEVSHKLGISKGEVLLIKELYLK